MADPQERIGQQIGEYRLLRQLGKGTFGTVYLAEHFHNHSYAAVKLLQIRLTSRDDLRDFLNEARMIRLRHPHIVPILDFGLSRDDLPFLVMEYAAGGTLRDRHSKGSKLPGEIIATYVQQLASALHYAHDRRLIHRDVKPENMLVRRDGTVLLSDFGIAKIIEQSSLNSMHTQTGTPVYMAPEQSQGKPCPASDQYALAVVVYEWLSGSRPFQGGPLEVIIQHRVDPPPSLHAVCPEISLQVEQVILKALAKAPEERFPTMAHFARAFHIAMGETHVQMRTIPNLQTHSIDIAPTTPTHLTAMLPPEQQQVPLVPSMEPSTQGIMPNEIVPSSPPAPGSQISHASGRPEARPARRSQVTPPRLDYRRVVLLTLLCLMLFIGAGGGGTWLFVTQQNQQRARSATATATVAPLATAMATRATATAQANIILSDPLSTNIHNNWLVTPPDEYAFKNGAYHITDPDNNGRVTVLSGESFTEPIGYTLTMQEVNGDDGSGQNSFGMIFCFNQQSKSGTTVTTFYSFVVVNVKGGRYQFWKYDDSKGANTSPWTNIWSAPFGNEFHQGHGAQSANTFKVFMNGGTFTITVNGKPLNQTVKDGSFASGMVGMTVNLKGTEVAFSNLLLTKQ